ncbi:MAG: excinuclease ABC subunit UvrC, partial [Bacteroidales bacterium]|nr:excinuclease ABC subunit UvrC [Bacteroidales bacterium]
FPRVQLVRNPNLNDGSAYFGPYTSVGIVKEVFSMVKSAYPLRSCSLRLTPEAIAAGKFRLCLEYHIGRCKGPCTGLQSEEDYLLSIDQIHQILRGNISQVMNSLKDAMKAYALSYEFEAAETIKRRLEGLERFRTRSTVVNPSIHNVDVFTLLDDPDKAWVNFLKVVNGSIVQAHSVEIIKRLQETPEDLLLYAVIELRRRFNSVSKEVIIPFEVTQTLPGIQFTVPRIGDKRKLIELSEHNLKYFRMERCKQEEKKNPERHVNRILERARNDLRLSELPVHIECFDNSNLQGTDAVSSCVVFKNAKPSRSDYRKFHVKTVVGADDYATMDEVITRRYSRMIREESSLPQLIIVDGGKGQLGVVVKALEKLGLRGKIAVIGIAKRLEEIFFPGDSLPLYLDKQSETLRLIQSLRNEAHRFGITFHREKRSKSMLISALDEIPGIGPASRKKLLEAFSSVSKIKSASPEALAEVLGVAKARLIYAHFNQDKGIV